MTTVTLFAYEKQLYKKQNEFLPFLENCSHITRCAHSASTAIGWAQTRTSIQAEHYAREQSLAFWHLKDGFVSFMNDPTDQKSVRLSLIVDQAGMCSETTRPDDLEKLLTQMDWCDKEYLQRSRQLLDCILQYRISRYNSALHKKLPATAARKFLPDTSRVLVVDQPEAEWLQPNEQLISNPFQQMLETAIAENPHAQIIIDASSRAISGKKQSQFEQLPENCTVLDENVNPFAVLEKVARVYTVSSQLGFEALLAGKRVVCFGMPFYAGRGLTDDRVTPVRPRSKRSLEQLFAAAYMQYPRYVDPITGRRCQLDDIISFIIAQEKNYDDYYDRMLAPGLSRWRRRNIRYFAQKITRRLIFHKPLVRQHKLPMLVWASKHQARQSHDEKIYYVEDGFLRSVGLGANGVRPYSLIIDDRGIYYDSNKPSMLEHYLNTHRFTEQELITGQQILNKITAASLSKYNVGTGKTVDFTKLAGNRKVLLIPGQISDDASVVQGSPYIKDNATLIQSVRKQQPEAFIVYKVHPDTLSRKKRNGHVAPGILDSCVDYTVWEMNITECFALCNEVHTLTSLSGMEALMYGLPVTVWGQPFYAGWGLTTDVYPVRRRGRNLPLSALVYAAYAWYPIYYDWESGFFGTVLEIITKMQQQKQG